MKAVVYHPKVPAEVRAFLEYYDAISSSLGDAFWHELTEAINFAREFPDQRRHDSSSMETFWAAISFFNRW